MKINQTIKKLIKLSVVTVLLGAVTTSTVFASETWTARTVEDIKADLKNDSTGASAYTIKWGDTLYAISLAADISIEQLAKVNDIDNIRLIHTGNTIYFNEDKSVITLATQNEDKVSVQSFDVASGEEVATPQQTIEKIEQIAQKPEQKQEETVEQPSEQPETQEAPETTQATPQPAESAPAGVEPVAVTSSSPRVYTLSEFLYTGVINWGSYKFTYYSQSVLPGGGLNIPGRHVNADGYVVDGDGYIVLANSAPKGTVINTPFGAQGKVYDRGTSGNHFDVYVR